MYRLLQRTKAVKKSGNFLPSSCYKLLPTETSRQMMSTNRPSPLEGPIHWVLDWDGTITKKDTLDALVKIAASAEPISPILDRWKHVVDAYITDYTATLEKLVPGGTLPTTIEGERKLLKDMEDVEQRSLDRVYESKIFRFLTAQQVADGAQKAIASGDVAIRPGFLDLMQYLSTKAVSNEDDFHILSVNWSRHFISSCLKAAGAKVDPLLIFANELHGITHGIPSSGRIISKKDNRLISSDDKLRDLEVMREISQIPTVYIGDSGTDIECLHAADLGICIRDEPMSSSQRKLSETLDRLAVVCPHLSDWTQADSSQIVWSRNFVEIQEWDKSRNVEDRH